MLLLLLVQRVEPNLRSASSAGRGWNSSKGDGVKLVEVVLIIVHSDPGRFSPVLRDIGHLLLLAQHLNLSLLLLGYGKEIVQRVFLWVILRISPRHIFCQRAVGKFKWIAIARAISLISLGA